ncbi:pyrroloquinoline quinone biosynthesis protein PqqB [Umezawaea sp.]|uniref:pyrroloquinoline quinone biosynthesis protein PqqB n=1 Tax=Umezawaea sp. TaxID=1955258 RepID=UPI002ED0158F
MRAVLLGTAAGGGFPQWNCACGPCEAARAGRLRSRTQDCLAVSGDGEDWWLFNASPDVRAQLVATAALAPGPGPRDTPVRGVVLTDAELDHALGLLALRGAAGTEVRATSTVLDALRGDLDLRGVLDGYSPWTWREVEPHEPFELRGGLVVTAVPVSGKRPRYAAASAVGSDWVVAYRVEDQRTGGVLVYAPCLATWPHELERLLADADVLLLDGTFHSAGEMGASTGGTHGQAAMGHLPITASLPELRRHPGVRRIYTHLNNTNPVLDPDSPEHAELVAAGVEVPPDGTVVEI